MVHNNPSHNYDLIPLNQPYTLIYSGPLLYPSHLKLIKHHGDVYTFIPLTCGLHGIRYGTNIFYLEVVPEVIQITLLLLYTNIITGYSYQGTIYTTQGTIASELTYDQSIPIKIKKCNGTLEFYLTNNNITYGPPKSQLRSQSLGYIIIDF